MRSSVCLFLILLFFNTSGLIFLFFSIQSLSLEKHSVKLHILVWAWELDATTMLLTGGSGWLEVTG